MAQMQRAILSCYDKTGLVEFATFLREYNVEIVSTAGTLHLLREAGIEASGIADFTGIPEMLDGRVKSLHPKIHAGLLGVRENKLHVEQMQAYSYQWIDLVVVNLHPIERLTANSQLTIDEVVDQIDIGGMAMIRSAAKNFRYVGCIVKPERYASVMHEMRAHEGEIPFYNRFKLAQEAFETTAHYDRLLAEYFGNTTLPEGSQ